MRTMKCIVCKKEFDSTREIIKEGVLKGCEVVDVYCSEKCKKELETKIKDYDAKSEKKVPTHKEFQKAVDKAGLRSYEFKDANSESSEVKDE